MAREVPAAKVAVAAQRAQTFWPRTAKIVVIQLATPSAPITERITSQAVTAVSMRSVE